MRTLFCLIIILLSSVVNAQEWKVDWNASARMAGSTGEYMPFWARTGQDGILPVRSSGLITAGADIAYNDNKGFYFEAGTNLAGALALKSPLNDKAVYGMVDRLYVSGGWKMLHLDAGMKPREREFGDLSITGGNIVLSGNTRNMPGINAWSDWIYFEKGHWFGIRGNFAHYKMMDNRYVKGANIHNKSFAFKIALGRKVDFEAGLDHWAQWGGVSQAIGECPASFKDYMRIVLGKGGGSDATLSDQQNALGNHLGREYIRVTWRASAFSMLFQYDMPFEDGGQIIKTEPIPDGVYTLKFSFNDRKKWVTDIVYEYIHTTWQSGSYHDRPATEEEMTKDYGEYVYWQDPNHHYYGRYVLGGKDNYFNNGEYRSGWTYFGRSIGLPLMVPMTPDGNGMSWGFVSNRVRAHHIGLAGVAFDIPYSFKATYSSNWGTYNVPFKDKPKQLSLALEAELGKNVTKLPVNFAVGLYGDFGKLYQNSAGITLRVTYKDSRRF